MDVGSSTSVITSAPVAAPTAAAPTSAASTVGALADSSLGPSVSSTAVELRNTTAPPVTIEPRGPVSVSYSKATAPAFVAGLPTGQAGQDAEQVREAPVDINSGTPEQQKKARQDLVASTPQINQTAILKGDSMKTCGAASQTAALILSDKDGKNAAALEGVAHKQGLTLSDDEKTAMSNFKSGNLSPKDVENLQQVVYRSSVKMGTGKEPTGVEVTQDGLDLASKKNGYQPSDSEQKALTQWKTDESKVTPAEASTLRDFAVHSGLVKDKSQIADLDQEKLINHEVTTAEMSGMTSALRAQGAYADGPNITYTASQLSGPDGRTVNHWTAQVGDTYYNSVAADPNGPAVVSDHPGPEVATGPAKGNFVSRVSLSGQGDQQSLTADLTSHDNQPNAYDRVQFQPPAGGGTKAWSGAESDFTKIAHNQQKVQSNSKEPQENISKQTQITFDKPTDY